ncbi:MAG TPA: polyhydroxyalkanoate granule-associated phasin [Burkholderiales bacterium]|nr:polyhydroxyalkanoate granule-associated phasin [Burkholderiales bacterium]
MYWLPKSFVADGWQNGFKMWEVAWASPQVIAHRVQRMMTPAFFPGSHDQKEFVRMGQEKLEAFFESWLAIVMQMQTFQTQLASAAVRQSLAGPAALASLMSAKTLGQITRAQTTFLRSMIVSGGKRNVSAAFAKVAAQGLHPVHRRVTANARRLRLVKKR